jgi:hypothetical protein
VQRILPVDGFLDEIPVTAKDRGQPTSGGVGILYDQDSSRTRVITGRRVGRPLSVHRFLKMP